MILPPVLSVPLAFAGPVRRSRAAHDTALHAIGLAIVRGDYPIGSLLPSKDELMRWLSVSQTTLREALQTLSAKGMIAAKAKVGTRVLDETQWNMFDADILAWRLEVGIAPSFLARLFEIRQSLEPVAAALAAGRRTEADVVALRRLADGMRDASGDTAAFARADVAFHQLILSTSHNPFMHSIGALISTALHASFTLSAPTHEPHLVDLAHRQHLDIVDAIEAADAQRAAETMLMVIRQGWTNYSGAAATQVATLAVLSFHQSVDEGALAERS